MAPPKPVPGGYRKQDAQLDNGLGDIVDACAAEAPWRTHSAVLRSVPLRTNILLDPTSLGTQLSNGLKESFAGEAVRLNVSLLFCRPGLLN